MKKLFLIILVIAVNFSKSQSQDITKEYIISFYNVENLFDTINDPLIKDDDFTPEGKKQWTSEKYQKKLNDLAHVISSLQTNLPDIVGFAEVENQLVLEDLIKTHYLNQNNYGIVHENSPDARGIDVALIYAKDRIKYIEHKTIPVPLETKYKVRDILYFKGAIEKKDTIHVFVNHWKSRSGGTEKTEPQRIQCALTLRSEIDSILTINNQANILVIGDLNDTPINKSVKETLRADNSKQEEALYNLMITYTENGLGTHSYRGEWSVLDHIIVSNSLLNPKSKIIVKDHKAHIFSADWITYENKSGGKSPNRTYGGPNYYGGYSDHYPVYVILKVQ